MFCGSRNTFSMAGGVKVTAGVRQGRLNGASRRPQLFLGRRGTSAPACLLMEEQGESSDASRLAQFL
jgi:hypothetical protein